ncbi:Ras-related protein Rab-5C [Tritrichomonas foetus]|uniref:Ras-related protein Rab-5C n=1 Tax=Tritrichomonas foetus TaxID=1144522 RepID=A0A1J4K527_9EUKA|nr:Ras-related protein Rab-5C [Tritrichomonas foetus]|eukprot:OHT04605.1 Ras-related protein Rab-5C [Tritrichomonas foetus]
MKNKIVLVGESGVGKTSLVKRWTSHIFRENQSPTIGAAYTSVDYIYAGVNRQVQIWDTAGEEKYRSMAPIYSRGAYGALVVFDLTSRPTFLRIPEWIEVVDSARSMVIVICGNKSDLEERREVSFEEASNFCQTNNYRYFETSASNGSYVQEVFEEIVEATFKNSEKELDVHVDDNNFKDLSGDGNKKGTLGGCC